MNSLLRRLLAPALLLAGTVVAAAANGQPALDSSAFRSPSDLTATLEPGNNVVLHWKNQATVEGGHWVEYTTPGDDFIKLEAITDPSVSSFQHRNLAPQTTLSYRLEPFFGRPTEAVSITTAVASPSDPLYPEGPLIGQNPFDSGEKTEGVSLRDPKTFFAAMPSGLTTKLSSPTSVELRWKNHASDADGFLLEIAARPEGPYRACALLPAKFTSFRKTGLPPTTKCFFRVRAFFYGPPSSTVTVTTAASAPGR